MGFYDAIRIGASGAVDSAYTVDRSLRFNSGDNPELTRTPSGAGNRKTWTLSFWVKISDDDLGSHGFLFSTGANSSNKVQINIESSNRLTFEAKSGGSTQAYIRPSNNLRDISAWYHFVIRVDTTDSTSTNRIKIYINGTQQTDLALSTFPSQHTEFEWNKAQEHNIGKRTYSSNYFNGYFTEINFIDGQAYDPSYFGETDAVTGQWNPKKYVGSYGTNGFYLNFSDNSGTTATTLGKDSSGNGNNFTPNNFSVSAGAGNDSVEDTPTNNWCTLNPLAMRTNGNVTPSNGNLDASFGSSSGGIAGTFAVSSGKWYWEITITATSSARIDIGVIDDTFETYNGTHRYNPGIDSKSYAYTSLGTKYNNNTDTSYGATYTTNDVIAIALDLDNGTITFYKNNVSQGQAFSGLTGGFLPGVGDGNSSGTHSISANFGQRAFAYTPPTDFKALNSANLPDPTILLPNKHFEPLIYTGNSNTSRDITGLQFQPDWVWIKRRSATANHRSLDSVRGSTKEIYPNRTFAESTFTGISSFNSDGFTLATADPNYNLNTATYVAANWNAGDTDGKTYTVKVHDFSGNNRYIFDDFQTQAVTLDLAEGGTYIFNMDDSSNASHPFMIGTTANDNTTAFGSGIVYKLDGVVKTFAQYHAGFAAATTRRLEFTIPASTNNLFYFCYAHSGMGGAINTNSTLGSSNFDGSRQATTKVNTSSGFSIISWTGTGSNLTVGHGLGVAPKVYIVKARTGSSGCDWFVYHKVIGATHNLRLNTSNASGAASDLFNNTEPTSSVLSIGSSSCINENNGTYITYAFSEVAGYSKFGSYIGNGSSNGTFVFTGFRPAWVMIKRTDIVGSWWIHDAKRNTFNVVDNYFFADTDAAELSFDNLDFLSNGFKLRLATYQPNTSGGTFIYMAFAESPFKNARAR